MYENHNAVLYLVDGVYISIEIMILGICLDRKTSEYSTIPYEQT